MSRFCEGLDACTKLAVLRGPRDEHGGSAWCCDHSPWKPAPDFSGLESVIPAKYTPIGDWYEKRVWPVP